jgi:hypothetical protein
MNQGQGRRGARWSLVTLPLRGTVVHRDRGEMESSPWGFSLWVKEGGGVVDLGWR